jgi:hypothetical protein
MLSVRSLVEFEQLLGREEQLWHEGIDLSAPFGW